MATHRQHQAQDTFQFVTFTCYEWLLLIQEAGVYDYLPFWFSKIEENGCSNCGYVIMPNHIHLLLYVPSDCQDVNRMIGEGKRFLAYEVVKRFKKLGKTGLLIKLSEGVQNKEREKGKMHQVFRLSFDAKEIIGYESITRVLDYMHHNPVKGKWDLVDDFTQYSYSSAAFYELGQNSFIRVKDFRSVMRDV